MAREVTKDAYRFDSMLIYVLSFFFGMLLAFGSVTTLVGAILWLDAGGTNLAYAIMLLGAGMCGVAALGGLAVWQRVWLFLFKIAIALVALGACIFVFIVIAYVVAADMKSPAATFAKDNWNRGYNIKKKDLWKDSPMYCKHAAELAVGCYGKKECPKREGTVYALTPAKGIDACEGKALNIIDDDTKCDLACRDEWVATANEVLRPAGTTCTYLFFVIIVTIVVNNEVRLDDGMDKVLKHKVAYALNGLLMLLGIILVMGQLLASEGSWAGHALFGLGVILLGATASAFVGVYMDWELFMKVTNAILLFLGMILCAFSVLINLYTNQLDLINGYYDDNWPDIRAEIDKNNEALCVDLSEEDCKKRVRKKTKEIIGYVAIGGGCIEAFLVVITYLALRGVRFWRGTSEKEDLDWDQDSEEEESNPLNDSDSD